MHKDLDKLMDHEFGNIFIDKRHLKGKNAIIYYHYKKCIAHFLKNEISNINQQGSFKILDLEKEYIIENEIEINKLKKPVKLKGVIDRIDSTSDGIRLIDYKSGLVQPQELIINSIDQIEKKSKALQLLFYGLLYSKNQNLSSPLTAQIISIKNTHQNTINLKLNKQQYITADHINSFEGWLKEKILKMNNQSMVFKHNSESKYCEWC
jgi:ATP-dependent exoDNAse (exonuclease V) beta subunit